MTMDPISMLQPFRETGVLTSLDTEFALLMVELSGGEASSGLALASALTSRATRTGHVCLDLSRAEEILFPQGRPSGSPFLPPPRLWQEEIRRARVIGFPGGQPTPLVLDKAGRLYLHRYWSYQEALSRWIRRQSARVDPVQDMPSLQHTLTQLFPSSDSRLAGPDWQKIAACTALLRRFTVISGGPGTGKTTTAARILALIRVYAGEKSPRFALAAPTGKAAARLGEAVRAARSALPFPDSLVADLPERATTIHRLLGSIPGSPYFRHHKDRPLPVDVLVVDEASMVDLALMAKLVQALPPDARLILLGDRDQLASVEAGAVLGDICGAGSDSLFSPPFHALLKQATNQEIPGPGRKDAADPVGDSIVLLRQSRRFEEGSGVALVSRLVNAGDPDAVISSLRDPHRNDVLWQPLPRRSSLGRALRDRAIGPIAKALKEREPMQVLARFDEFRILCALREGPFGATAVNLLVERHLVESGLVPAHGRWYAGRPLMIARNDYALQLFNGDMGIVMPSPDGDLRACFPMPDGSIRTIHPMRLPEHETAFAVTVHKSQGSEFDRVLLILPDHSSPVLTRELIYTAVTRARRSVEIWSPETVLRDAVERRTRRFSGLHDAVWKP